jgi:uncharacterized protein YkwD
MARLHPRFVRAFAAACVCLCASAAPALAGHHKGRPRAHRSSFCANADLRPSASNIGLVRTATRCLVNRERVTRGEQPLTSSPRLAVAAERHTLSMAFRGYFAHVGPGGDTPLTRIRAAGYLFSAHGSYEVGENIAWGTLHLGTPRAIVAAWMASPEHRANILDRRYRSTALGVSPHVPWSLAGGQPGGIYTEDFGSIG